MGECSPLIVGVGIRWGSDDTPGISDNDEGDFGVTTGLGFQRWRQSCRQMKMGPRVQFRQLRHRQSKRNIGLARNNGFDGGGSNEVTTSLKNKQRQRLRPWRKTVPRDHWTMTGASAKNILKPMRLMERRLRLSWRCYDYCPEGLTTTIDASSEDGDS